MQEPTEAFALVSSAIDVDLGAEHGAEWHEHLRQFGVAHLLRQVVYEQVAHLRTCSPIIKLFSSILINHSDF